MLHQHDARPHTSATKSVVTDVSDLNLSHIFPRACIWHRLTPGC